MTPPRQPDLTLSVTVSDPDPWQAKVGLAALFQMMGPDLPAIAERMGLPLTLRMSPEAYAARHAELTAFVLANEWDCPIPVSIPSSRGSP